MKKLIALVAMSLCGIVFADTYVPVEFVQTDGNSYIDTGVPGNAKRISQNAWFQMLNITGDRTAVFGSYGAEGVLSKESCAIYFRTDRIAGYVGSEDVGGGYAVGNPVIDQMYLIRLHDGVLQANNVTVAMDPKTGKGYNWPTMKDKELPTLCLGNARSPDGFYNAPGASMPVRWFEYEAIDATTGETLIHLTPAQCVETKVFGMLDSVNGGFYPSADADHPLAGPERVSWDPAADYDSNALIVVPKDTTVIVDASAVAKINKTGGICVEDVSSVFSFSNFAATVSLYAPFWGKGEVRYEEGNAGKQLRFYADNRAFGGSVTIHNADTLVYQIRAFGVTNKFSYTDLVSTPQKTWKLDFQTSGAMSNECHFGGTAAQSGRIVQSASGRLVFAGPVFLNLEMGFTLNGGNGGFEFSGPVTNTMETGSMIYTSTKTVLFTDGYDRYFGKDFFYFTGPATLGGRMHFLDRKEYSVWANPQDFGNVGMSSGVVVSFLNANVFDDNLIYLVGRGSGTAVASLAGTMDLCGFDQRVGRFVTGVPPMAAGDTYPQAPNLQICSAEPACLTIRNTATFGHKNSSYDICPTLYPGRLNGKASLAIDTASTSASPGAIRFSCPGSDTAGGLYARRGTIEIFDSATFSNLTALVVSGEGSIIVNSSEIGNGAGAAGLAVVLSNNAASVSAPLTLAAGVVLAARTASVRDGKWLEPGTYGSADAIAAAGEGVVVPKLNGLGLLTVAEYGGPKGLMLIVR